jgi:hypothetical protein
MRGRSVPFSRARRSVGDLIALAEAGTRAIIRRRMRLAPLAAAMAASPWRPLWSAVFVKAFALVAAADPQLRRAYVRLPWPRLYEYPQSVALVAVERELDGEAAVFFARMKQPEEMALSEIADVLRYAKTAPVDSISDFRRMLRVAGLPRPLRRLMWWVGLNLGRQRANYFGTFGVSTVAGEGATIESTLNPVSFTLTYSPLSATGEIDVVLSFDHRVLDGAAVARALSALEAALNGPILAEVEEGGRPALHIVAARS